MASKPPKPRQSLMQRARDSMGASASAKAGGLPSASRQGGGSSRAARGDVQARREAHLLRHGRVRRMRALACAAPACLAQWLTQHARAAPRRGPRTCCCLGAPAGERHGRVAAACAHARGHDGRRRGRLGRGGLRRQRALAGAVPTPVARRCVPVDRRPPPPPHTPSAPARAPPLLRVHASLWRDRCYCRCQAHKCPKPALWSRSAPATILTTGTSSIAA